MTFEVLTGLSGLSITAGALAVAAASGYYAHRTRAKTVRRIDNRFRWHLASLETRVDAVSSQLDYSRERVLAEIQIPEIRDAFIGLNTGGPLVNIEGVISQIEEGLSMWSGLPFSEKYSRAQEYPYKIPTTKGIAIVD